MSTEVDSVEVDLIHRQAVRALSPMATRLALQVHVGGSSTPLSTPTQAIFRNRIVPLPHPSRVLDLSRIGRVKHAIVDIAILIEPPIISPPRRERHRLPTPSKDRKTQDENKNLSPSVHGRGDEIVIADEELRVVLAQVPLREEADEEVAEDGRVDADEEVSHVPEDDTEVEVLEEADLGVAVQEPEGERDREAQEVRERDPLVPPADGEHLAGDGPRDSEGVVLLDVLAGPDVGAGDGGKDVILVGDDGLHHNVIEDGAEDAAPHLGGEGGFGGEMGELGELKVAEEELALLDAVEAEDGEVHVCWGLCQLSCSGKHGPSCSMEIRALGGTHL